MENTEQLLRSKYQRRWFYISGVAAFVAVISIRFFILPYFSGEQPQGVLVIVNSILDNLTAALVAGLATTSIILWLTPPQQSRALVKIVEPVELKKTLKDALTQTNEFWYRGHTARWTRCVTVPQLAAEARAENISKNVYVIIIDPHNITVCDYYSRYRQRLRSATKSEQWTAKKVQLELIGTIVSAYAWQAQEPSLNISMALSDKVSLFRVDLTATSAVITQEDTREPALRCDADSIFYKAFREDVIMTYQQSRILPKAQGVPFNDLTISNVRALLNDLGFVGMGLNDDDLMRVIAIARDAVNPYP
jgi:hypothetical protein